MRNQSKVEDTRYKNQAHPICIINSILSHERHIKFPGTGYFVATEYTETLNYLLISPCVSVAKFMRIITVSITLTSDQKLERSLISCWRLQFLPGYFFITLCSIINKGCHNDRSLLQIFRHEVIVVIHI